MDSKTVEHIAHLAKLSITPEEAKAYSAQLTAILEHFNELNALNTDGVEPLRTPSHIEENLREDIVRMGPGADAILENAPDKLGTLFKVPTVV